MFSVIKIYIYTYSWEYGYFFNIDISRLVCNLCFADDIDLIARTETELQELTTNL
jgi:hypothetical protein